MVVSAVLAVVEEVVMEVVGLKRVWIARKVVLMTVQTRHYIPR